MTLDATFTANEKKLDADFQSSLNVSGGYEEGYEQGKIDGSNITQYITNIYRMFYQTTFPEGYELDLIVKNSVNSTPASDMMGFLNQAKGLKSVKLSFIDKGATLSANYCFAGYSSTDVDNLELIDISGMACTFSSFAGAFQNRTSLKSIIGDIDLTGCINVNSAFYNCLALEDVEFAQGTIPKSIQFNNSPNLSDTSIQSIIDGLADLTGGTQQTITFHADVKAKLTDEQKTTITNKNWLLG